MALRKTENFEFFVGCVGPKSFWIFSLYHNSATFFKSFVHTAVFLTTGPESLPKPVLYIEQASASYFKLQCPTLSLRSSSSCLSLLPRLPVTYIIPPIFPSITCLRRQFLRKMWPIQLAFLLLIVCRIFLSSLTQCKTSSLTRSVQLIFIFLQHRVLEISRYFWSSYWSTATYPIQSMDSKNHGQMTQYSEGHIKKNVSKK